MKSFALLAPFVLLAVQSVGATPLGKRDDPTQAQILQYALTLEHLENAFYHGALAKFNDKAFEKAGYPSYVRGRMVQISMHEQAHVDFLTSALGSSAVAACEYSFPYDDPKSFLALSEVLESVGTAAYLGGAKYITDPTVLTAAGSILTTEARHAAWVNAVPMKGSPWSGPYDTPLDQNQVFTLAASFIKSCPQSNPTLPFKAFPKLTVNGNAAPGKRVKLDFQDSGSGPRYLALFSGLKTDFVAINGNKEVTIPKDLQGLVFGVVTSDGQTVSDANTVAGVAIINIPIPSYVSNP